MTEFEKKLGAFFKNQIETDSSEVYGGGFRAGYLAVQRYGLRTTLDHMKLTGSFPCWSNWSKAVPFFDLRGGCTWAVFLVSNFQLYTYTYQRREICLLWTSTWLQSYCFSHRVNNTCRSSDREISTFSRQCWHILEKIKRWGTLSMLRSACQPNFVTSDYERISSLFSLHCHGTNHKRSVF